MAKMTPSEARQYLANVAKSGETTWQPAKPLSEYKDAQVTRKAREFKQMERAQLPIDNRVARGHAKGERGHEAKLAASREAYVTARNAQKAGLDVQFTKGKKHLAEVKVKDDRSARRALDVLAHSSPSTRVSIKYQSADGMWHIMYQKGGRSIDSIRDELEGYADIQEWLEAQSEAEYGTDTFAAGMAFSLVVAA